MLKKTIYISSVSICFFMSIVLFYQSIIKFLSYEYGHVVKCVIYKKDDHDIYYYYYGKLCSYYSDYMIEEKIGDSLMFYHWDKIPESFFK